jgi:signal transduction histidine kinase
MPAAPLPPNELERLAALRALEVLDSITEPQFDALVDAASSIAGTPISLVSLVDESRQWFKAGVGLGDVRETDRSSAFCAHTILGDDVLEVQDTLKDERFAENPLVTGDPRIRYYCGVPLKLSGGAQVGSLCVIDRVPRSMDPSQLKSLHHLAVAAAAALEGRKATLELVRRSGQLAASEGELETANEFLRSFVRVASHDLKSPLITVNRLVEWAAEAIDEGDLKAAHGHLELVGTRLARMDTLLTDLRQFATLGAISETAETVDTWDLVERSFQWHEDSQSAQLALIGERLNVSVHVAPLEVVLRNLIGNAIKHHDSGTPSIQVSTALDASGKFVLFSVVDDGPGIAANFHEAIFEPLRTLQPRDVVEGSGLGLSIVKRTVESAGGEISLESDGVSGTTFHLKWPLEGS